MFSGADTTITLLNASEIKTPSECKLLMERGIVLQEIF